MKIIFCKIRHIPIILWKTLYFLLPKILSNFLFSNTVHKRYNYYVINTNYRHWRRPSRPFSSSHRARERRTSRFNRKKPFLWRKLNKSNIRNKRGRDSNPKGQNSRKRSTVRGCHSPGEGKDLPNLQGKRKQGGQRSPKT